MRIYELFESAIPSIGINVRSDGDIDYANLILDGKKRWESREKTTLNSYIGKRVGIVRTGSGKAMALGSVIVGEPIQVDEKEFRKLQSEHLVPPGSKFDIKPGQTKWLYPMIEPQRFDEPFPVAHGIVARKILPKM